MGRNESAWRSAMRPPPSPSRWNLSRRSRSPKSLDRIKAIVKEQQVREILVGMPRNMNGTYGPAAESARKFAATLREALGIPVNTWDERLTSVQANRFLIEAGMRREQRKTKADQSAAAILLQSYLDAAAVRSENTGE